MGKMCIEVYTETFGARYMDSKACAKVCARVCAKVCAKVCASVCARVCAYGIRKVCATVHDKRKIMEEDMRYGMRRLVY